MEHSDKKYLNSEEISLLQLSQERTEISKLLVELKKKEIEISKLQEQILLKDTELKQIQIEKQIAIVSDLKQKVVKNRERTQGFIKTLESKYKLKKFAGYDPLSGEIAEEHP